MPNLSVRAGGNPERAAARGSTTSSFCESARVKPAQARSLPRQARCKSFHDAKPLLARRSQDVEARSLCRRHAARGSTTRNLSQRACGSAKRTAARGSTTPNLSPRDRRKTKRRSRFVERHAARGSTTQPLAACLWEPEEARCKRFHDAEPSRATVGRRRGALASSRGTLQEVPRRATSHSVPVGARKDRCERFDVAEPLPRHGGNTPGALVGPIASLVEGIVTRPAARRPGPSWRTPRSSRLAPRTSRRRRRRGGLQGLGLHREGTL